MKESLRLRGLDVLCGCALDAHWYLPLVGVDFDAQGRGLGSELTQHRLAQSDAAGLPAYLESSNPRNISLSQRHGFEVLGEIQVGAGPLVTPMRRHPRGAKFRNRDGL